MSDFDNQDSDDEGRKKKGGRRRQKQEINSHFASRFEEVFGKEVVDAAVNKRRRIEDPEEEMIEEKPLPHNPLVNGTLSSQLLFLFSLRTFFQRYEFS